MLEINLFPNHKPRHSLIIRGLTYEWIVVLSPQCQVLDSSTHYPPSLPPVLRLWLTPVWSVLFSLVQLWFSFIIKLFVISKPFLEVGDYVFNNVYNTVLLCLHSLICMTTVICETLNYCDALLKNISQI